MKRVALILSLHVIFLSSTILAGPLFTDTGDSATAGEHSVVISDLGSSVDYGMGFFGSVAKMDQQHLIAAGAIAGFSGLLFLADKPVQSLALRNQSPFNNDLFHWTELYGATGTGFALSGSIYGTGLLFGDTEIRKTGLYMFEALVLSGVTTEFLKGTLGRSRPYLNEGNVSFRPLQFNAGRTSLPSGHTTIAFAVSSVLAERIHNRAVSVGLYSLAGLTAFARVYHNVHWISDTFLGAAVGTLTGIAVVRFNEEIQHRSEAELNLTPNGIAVTLHL